MILRGWLRRITIISAAVKLSHALVQVGKESSPAGALPSLPTRRATTATAPVLVAPAAAAVERRQWMASTVAGWMAAMLAPTLAVATDASSSTLPRISDEELKRIVTSDLVDNQFLVTGKITRDIYLDDATFTDEIDTYGLDQWVKGTQKLFVGEGSQVRLVGDVQVSPESVEFRFDEDLMFRIPFRPVVKLSGRLVLTRDPGSGLISSYREYWDQDVATVLKSAKF